MNHEYERNRANTPAATSNHETMADPGRSSRSALLRKSDHATASGLVQRRVAPRTGKSSQSARGQPGAGDVHGFAGEGISGPATTLPFLEQIQRSFGGHDISNIQAHIGGPAVEACEGMGARAYATGNHVAFREAPDLHTAAHEAAHVVQQKVGVQLAGGVGQTGDEYERNADQAADAVVAGKPADMLLGGTGHHEANESTPCAKCRSRTVGYDGTNVRSVQHKSDDSAPEQDDPTQQQPTELASQNLPADGDSSATELTQGGCGGTVGVNRPGTSDIVNFLDSGTFFVSGNCTRIDVTMTAGWVGVGCTSGPDMYPVSIVDQNGQQVAAPQRYPTGSEEILEECRQNAPRHRTDTHIFRVPRGGPYRIRISTDGAGEPGNLWLRASGSGRIH